VIRLLLVTAAGIGLVADAPTPKAWDKADLGKVPTGWKSLSTGEKAATKWVLKADEKAKLVLTQTGKSPNPVFNLCVADEPTVADLEATVSFSALSGKKDQGGGLVWRFQDANNYYVARMNPLEDNFRLYKVIDGKRKQLATVEDIVVKSNTWHTMTIRMKADAIECWLDDKKHLTATDSTIKKAGRVGVWTKADAVTAFAGLKIGPAPK
jgi:Domain of Unknown Function (DUF1080)